MWPLATKLKTIVTTRKTFVDNFERSDNFRNLNKCKNEAYEKEQFLGSGDSRGDRGTDGGTDRTGNYELYGLRTVLRR